jgi:hypothetical protein
MTTVQTEAWQRGPVPGFEPLLMPVVHALIQAREDLERLITTVPPDHVWRRPGGAASIGFHVRHAGGALDRLLTYARGEALSDAQRAAVKAEGSRGSACTARRGRCRRRSHHRCGDGPTARHAARLPPRRTQGWPGGLPATVLGLLFHAAEHTNRHVGQAITTALIQRP